LKRKPARQVNQMSDDVSKVGPSDLFYSPCSDSEMDDLKKIAMIADLISIRTYLFEKSSMRVFPFVSKENEAKIKSQQKIKDSYLKMSKIVEDEIDKTIKEVFDEQYYQHD